jgi:hypothetical protein
MLAKQRRPGVVICSHRRINYGASLGRDGVRGSGVTSILVRPLPCTFRNRPGYERVGIVTENLRIHCPPALPVIVRAGRTGPENSGYCACRDNKFVITIDHALSCDSVLETLIHEWAHSLAWNYMLEKAALELTHGQIDQAEFEDRAHGPEFGVAFATVWRVFVRKILPVLRSQ